MKKLLMALLIGLSFTTPVKAEEEITYTANGEVVEDTAAQQEIQDKADNGDVEITEDNTTTVIEVSNDVEEKDDGTVIDTTTIDETITTTEEVEVVIGEEESPARIEVVGDYDPDAEVLETVEDLDEVENQVLTREEGEVIQEDITDLPVEPDDKTNTIPVAQTFAQNTGTGNKEDVQYYDLTEGQTIEDNQRGFDLVDGEVVSRSTTHFTSNLGTTEVPDYVYSGFEEAGYDNKIDWRDKGNGIAVNADKGNNLCWMYDDANREIYGKAMDAEGLSLVISSLNGKAQLVNEDGTERYEILVYPKEAFVFSSYVLKRELDTLHIDGIIAKIDGTTKISSIINITNQEPTVITKKEIVVVDEQNNVYQIIKTTTPPTPDPVVEEPEEEPTPTIEPETPKAEEPPVITPAPVAPTPVVVVETPAVKEEVVVERVAYVIPDTADRG